MRRIVRELKWMRARNISSWNTKFLFYKNNNYSSKMNTVQPSTILGERWYWLEIFHSIFVFDRKYNQYSAWPKL